jgi:hypothetical protein
LLDAIVGAAASLTQLQVAFERELASLSGNVVLGNANDQGAQPTSAPDALAQVSALIAFAVLVVGIVAVLVSNAGNRGQRLAFTSEIRSQWEQLHGSWSTAILLHDMTWSYYSDASVEEKDRVSKLIALVNAKPKAIEKNVELLRQETRGLRQIARFFAYVAEAILSGRMSTRDAYAIFGPDVARHPRSIFWIAGRESIRQSAVDSNEWSVLADQIIEPNFFNDQDLIVAFGNLMLSELAKRGDGHPHLILERAYDRNQKPERARVRKETGRLIRGGFSLGRRLLIGRQLSFSARVRWNAVRPRSGREPIFYEGDEVLIRWPFGLGWAFRALFRRRFPEIGPRPLQRDGR